MARARAHVKAAHLSGRWDRKAWRLRRQLKRAARRGPTVITLTEVADRDRPKAVRLPGYAKVQVADGPGGKRFDLGECAMLIKRDTWKVQRSRVYVLGPDRGPGNRVIALMALLKHVETGLTLVVGTSHLMSAVEGDWSGRRASFYRTDMDRWRRIFVSWRRAFKPDAEVAVADWNLDLHRSWVAQHLDEAWGGHENPRQLPKRGTHGKRLIDFPRTRGVRALRLRVRSSLGASDHNELWWEGDIG